MTKCIKVTAVFENIFELDDGETFEEAAKSWEESIISCPSDFIHLEDTCIKVFSKKVNKHDEEHDEEQEENYDY